MATKLSNTPKLLPLLIRHLTRPLTTSSAVIATVSTAAPPVSPPILDLTDPQKLFSGVPTSKILRSSLNLHLASIDPMVDFGTWVVNSDLFNNSNFLRGVILGVIKHTFFEHFCAGEDTKESMECVKRMKGAGLRGMLDFAAEFAFDNDSCDKNFDGFLKTIESSSSLPPSSVSFVVVKMTAIFPLELLQRVGDLLRWQQRDPSVNFPWKDNTFPLFSNSSPLYHTLEQPQPLTSQEEQDLQLGLQRLSKLSEKCAEANIPLVVDAEHTQVQPAIDYFTYSAAIRHNKGDNPVVYNTIQTYLKDAKERLLLATKAAEKMGVPMGFKIVRGAYMTSERKLASTLGYEPPIHNTIHETHACYNDCTSFMLEKINDGTSAAILATHNVESGRLAAIKARDLGIKKGNQKLEFAQLYGMADALSFGLRNAGFQVSKYMPYGSVDETIPYLLRRAEENRGLISTSSLDRELMREELKRRLKAAIFYRS